MSKLIFRKHLLEKDLKERNQPVAGKWADIVDGREITKHSSGKLGWAGVQKEVIQTPIGPMTNAVHTAYQVEPEWCEEVS